MKIKNTFFTRRRIELLIALVIITATTAHGYINYEEALDNEKIEVQTVIANKESKIIKSSTTTIPIIVYHKIGTLAPLPLSKNYKQIRKFNVQADVFESQIQFIKSQGYTPLTIKELIEDKQNNTLPEKPIALTFDDGWRNQYENGLPILDKYHMVGTFYIYTGVIGSPLYMTWKQIHALADDHMEIGDHTKSHLDLTKIDPNNFEEELVQSKKVLERNLNMSVDDFAYPYGKYNDTVIKAVKKAGYLSARTSNAGIYNDFKDLYQINVLYAPSDLETLEKMLSRK